jgi:hypothetical protein
LSTRLHRFVPRDVRHVPPAAAVEQALQWLKANVDAYKIEVEAPGHVTFFDCGGGLDKIFCPHCKMELGAEAWKDWMDSAWTETKGFNLTTRLLDCCGKSASLENLGFDPVCAFGSFALVITDPTTTWSDDDFDTTLRKLETLLGCPLQRVDAHY